MLDTQTEDQIENTEGGIFDNETDDNIVDFPSPGETEEDTGGGGRVSADVGDSTKALVKKEVRTLLCVADATGNPMVAYATRLPDGGFSLLEDYRRPTQEEFEKLRKNGKIVSQPQPQPRQQTQMVRHQQEQVSQPQVMPPEEESFSPFDDEVQQDQVIDQSMPFGGVSAQPSEGQIVQQEQKPLISKNVKVAIFGVGVAALSGLGMWYYKKRKQAKAMAEEDFDDEED